MKKTRRAAHDCYTKTKHDPGWNTNTHTQSNTSFQFLTSVSLFSIRQDFVNQCRSMKYKGSYWPFSRNTIKGRKNFIFRSAGFSQIQSRPQHAVYKSRSSWVTSRNVFESCYNQEECKCPFQIFSDKCYEQNVTTAFFFLNVFYVSCSFSTIFSDEQSTNWWNT